MNMDASSVMTCCASCGKSGDDCRIKLKTCTACKSVKYCNVECQLNHRKSHKQECKRIEKQLKCKASSDDRNESSGAGKGKNGEKFKPVAKDVRLEDDVEDKDLFNVPPVEECPLCFLPLPNADSSTEYRDCCGQTLCGGCMIKNLAIWKATKPGQKSSCPFCRAVADTYATICSQTSMPTKGIPTPRC